MLDKEPLPTTTLNLHNGSGTTMVVGRIARRWMVWKGKCHLLEGVSEEWEVVMSPPDCKDYSEEP